jgi:hypothetical protein
MKALDRERLLRMPAVTSARQQQREKEGSLSFRTTLPGVRNDTYYYDSGVHTAPTKSVLIQERSSPALVGSNVSGCPYDFRVYVYDIPASLGSVRISFEARKNKTLHICQKCNLEQHALEYIVYDFFTQFCGRTRDPEAADFFYLPIVRDAEFRVALEHKNRAPSLTEQALLEILENVSTFIKRSAAQPVGPPRNGLYAFAYLLDVCALCVFYSPFSSLTMLL